MAEENQATPETAPDEVNNALSGDNNEAQEQDVTPAQDTKPEEKATVTNIEDWRKEMAGDDEKLNKLLGRYQSIKDVGKALQNANEKIRKGEAKTLPDNATDEELAEWRESQGIPKDWKEYDTTLDDGLVIGEADKPILDAVLESMHNVNAKPEHVKAAMEAFYRGRAAEMEQLEDKDATDSADTTARLRDEWGSDYKPNISVVENFVNKLPESVRDNVLNARMADGTALFNNADIIMHFANMERQINPAATVVPNSSNPMQTINDELDKLNAMMAKGKNGPYWKGPDADAHQKRWRELTAAQEEMNKKG